MRASPLRTVLVASMALLLLALSVRAWRSRSVELPLTGLPAPEEMDSLSRYLAPVDPAPRLDDYAAFLPARPEPLRYAVPVEEPVAPEVATVWQLSAILIAGARPVAIINDQAVAPGARLDDGTVVLEIAKDNVLIRAPNGARRRLFLTAG